MTVAFAVTFGIPSDHFSERDFVGYSTTKGSDLIGGY